MGLYPLFLDMGYEPSLFWILSLQEINDLMESYARKEERRRKEKEADIRDQAMLLYNHAMQCADAMAAIMPGNQEHKRTSLGEYYPELFPGLKEAEEKARIEKELKVHKARMKAYAEANNAARRKAGENNGRNDT
nr:MAG TPA: hypothetical protein [Caudoviricetes sp.]